MGGRGGLVGQRGGVRLGRLASWAARPTGPRPSREGGCFPFILLFSFYFSNFTLLFYLYAHLILFYKIYTEAPKLV